MPAQTASPGVVYVGENDTYPIPFIIVDNDKQPLSLTNAFDVRIDIAYARYSYYYSPTKLIVADRPLTIVRPQVDDDVGRVVYNPLPTDLTPPGTFKYSFRIEWSDGTFQTTPPYFYPVLQILTPVGGQVSRQGAP